MKECVANIANFTLNTPSQKKYGKVPIQKQPSIHNIKIKRKIVNKRNPNHINDKSR